EPLVGNRLWGRPQTQCQHIGMIPDACSAGSLGIVAEGCTHPWHFVGRYRGSRSGPTTDNPLLGLTGGDGLSRLAAGERPIHFRILLGHWSEKDDLMTALGEFFDQHIGEMGTFVASYRNFHAGLLVCLCVLRPGCPQHDPGLTIHTS